MEKSKDDVLFVSDIKRQYPHQYSNMIGVWQRTVRHHFPKDLVTRMSDNRLLNAREFGLDCQDINERHGVDFLNDVIPEVIERVKSEGGGRRVRILDSGCGLGFAADQMRVRFGDQVKVLGTSLVGGARVSARKREMINKLREESLFVMTACLDDPIVVSGEVRDRILASLGRETEPGDVEHRMLHANDAKWRSVLELSDYPEFDLIIDTYGELFYTDHVSYSDKDFRGNFRKVFCASLRKLMPGGTLYLASLKSAAQLRFIEKYKDELELEYGVRIECWAGVVDGIVLRKVVVHKR